MRLLIMGDSTMQENDASTYPQVGWPQALPLFLKNDFKIINLAKNGCSTKSFIDLGLFDKILVEAMPDDICLIQFGHNDSKIDNPLRYADPVVAYPNNLRFFINKLREKQVKPILLTSIYRRFFDDGVIRDNCHSTYPDVVKKVGEEMKVPVIDMCSLSKKMLSELGDEESKRLFMHFNAGIYENYPEGLLDNTHLRFDGAYEIAKIFIKEVIKNSFSLCKNIKDDIYYKYLVGDINEKNCS